MRDMMNRPSTTVLFILVFSAVVALTYLFCRYAFMVKSSSQAPSAAVQTSSRNWISGFSAALLVPALVVILSGGMIALALPVSIMAGLLGYYIPVWYSRHLAKKRVMDFDARILDLVVELASCLRAGAGIPQAMETVIRDLGGVASEELSLVLDDYRLGVPLPAAFASLCSRMPNEDLQILTTGLRVAVETGGSFADILDKISQTIRSRREFQQKLDSMIAQGQFEALAIAAMPVVAFAILYSIQPEMMKIMFEHPVGWIALAGVAVLETIGFVVLKQVTNVEP